MRYLILKDFDSKISRENFEVITGADESIVTEVESDVIDEISSYLGTRYDTSKIFLYYVPFEVGESYPIGTFLFLTAKPWSSTETYLEDALVADNKSVYIAIENETPNTDKPLTDTGFWLKIGKLNGFYTVKVAAAATDLTNTDHYTAGDARNALIKRYTVDIVLYELHSRINPRNIPEFRIQRRDDAIAWLKLVQNPRNNVNADFLPARDFGAQKGTDISWGGRTKQTNKY